MKTLEEIKQGLLCCAIVKSCDRCPYADDDGDCMDLLQSQALAYIKGLEGLVDMCNEGLDRLNAQVTQLLEEREEELREREREDFGAITVEEARKNGWR